MKFLNKEAKDTAVLVFSEEDGSGSKVLCFAYVPEKMQGAGLKANEWVNGALGELGGRGGGQPGSAQGQAPDSANLDAARAKATALAEGALVA